MNSNSQEQPKLDLAQQIPVDTLALTIDPQSLWLSQELRKTLLNMRYVHVGFPFPAFHGFVILLHSLPIQGVTQNEQC